MEKSMYDADWTVRMKCDIAFARACVHTQHLEHENKKKYKKYTQLGLIQNTSSVAVSQSVARMFATTSTTTTAESLSQNSFALYLVGSFH